MRIFAIGLGTVLLASGAAAQEHSDPARTASVDPAGHVIRVQPQAAPASAVVKAIGPCAARQPLSAQDARALLTKIATAEKFDPQFVMSVARAESRFDSTSLSVKGAYGLMQLMPETAQRYGVDLCDPAGNVLGGVRLLRALHAKYRNPLLTLAAYNAGEDAVLQSRGVPPFVETVRYVAQVLNDFYGWSLPAAEGRRASNPPSKTFDLSQPVGPDPAATAPVRTHWDNGFVMHID